MLTFQANPAHLPATPHTIGAEEDAGKASVEMSVETRVETRVETQVETRDKVIELLQTHPHLTLAEVAAQTGKSVSAVERVSAKLTSEGRLHLIEEFGEAGAKRILEDRVGDRVGEKVGDRVGEKVGKSLTSNQQQILELLRQHPHMAARELAQQVGISSRKIEQNIARLKKLQFLQRIGPAKGGHWEVLK